jgi:hypothetical protein
MKKFFLVFAIAGALVACNNAADSTAEAKDSIDSIASESKENIDSTAEQRMDQVDSTAAQAKDSLDKIDSAANK